MLFEYFKQFSDILLKTYLVTTLFGLSAFPISSKLFKKYSDYGFNVGKIIGLFFIGYIYFTLVTISSILNLKIFTLNSFFSWIVSLIIFILLQKIYLKDDFSKCKEFLKRSYKKILKFELLFLILLGSFFYLQSNFLFFTEGTESFLNVGIFKKIQNSETLPLLDFWMINHSFNYYYFGHFVFSQIQLLTKIDIDYLYYIICSLISSLFIITSAVFVRRYAKFSIFTLITILIFLGPIYGVIEYFTFPLSLENLNILSISVINGNVRTLPQAISENFSYSFIFMPAHAHSISLLLGILMTYLIIYLFEEKIALKILKKEYLLFGFFLSLFFMTNTWDFVFYLGLFIFIYILKNRKEFFQNFKINFVQLELIIFWSLFLTIPWKAFYESPNLAPGIVQNSSSLMEFFSFWQIYLFIFFAYLLYQKNNLKTIFKNIFSLMIIFCLIVLLFLEIFYLNDATGYRYNTYYKFSNQILLIFSLLSSIYLARILRYSKYFLLKFILVLLVTFCSLNFFIYVSFILDFENLNKIKPISHKFLSKDTHTKAYDFINNGYKKNNLVILEYPGNAYNNENLFSTLTGTNTVLGWKNHEYTWRRFDKFDPIIKNLENEVKEVYEGESEEEAKKILNKYQVNLIIIGPTEKLLASKKINEHKIQKISNLVFENSEIKIYEYHKN